MTIPYHMQRRPPHHSYVVICQLTTLYQVVFSVAIDTEIQQWHDVAVCCGVWRSRVCSSR